MNRSILLLMAALVAVSACGIKRPLIKPRDIPAYEAERAKKMKKFEEPASREPTLGDSQPGGTSLQDMMTPLPPVQQ